MEFGWVAYLSDKRGAIRFVTLQHAMPHDAVRALFAVLPNARKCTACCAKRGRPTYSDMRFFDRLSFDRAAP